MQTSDSDTNLSSLLDTRTRGGHARVQLKELLVVGDRVPLFQQHVHHFPIHGRLHACHTNVSLTPVSTCPLGCDCLQLLMARTNIMAALVLH